MFYIHHQLNIDKQYGGRGGHSLAVKSPIHDFVLVSDVTSQTGGGGEGAFTFVAGKLL